MLYTQNKQTIFEVLLVVHDLPRVKSSDPMSGVIQVPRRREGGEKP